MMGPDIEQLLAQACAYMAPDAEQELRAHLASGDITRAGLEKLLAVMREAGQRPRRSAFERAELEAMLANARMTRRLTPGLVRTLRAGFASRCYPTIEDAEAWVKKWPRGFADWAECPVGAAFTSYRDKTWAQMSPAERDALCEREPDLAEVMRKESN